MWGQKKSWGKFTAFRSQSAETFLMTGSVFYLFLVVGSASREDGAPHPHSRAEPLCAHDIPGVARGVG